MSWMQTYYDRRYARRSGQIDVLQSRVNTLTAQMIEQISETAASTHRVGRLTLPLLILGGTNTQTLTWTKPMPSDSYQVSVQQDAAIIGSATVQVLSITAAAVQIKTTETVAISAGAQLLVIAWNE